MYNIINSGVTGEFASSLIGIGMLKFHLNRTFSDISIIEINLRCFKRILESDNYFQTCSLNKLIITRGFREIFSKIQEIILFFIFRFQGLIDLDICRMLGRLRNCVMYSVILKSRTVFDLIRNLVLCPVGLMPTTISS